MKKVFIALGVVLLVFSLYLSMGGEDIKKAVTLKSMEVVGNIAMRSMPDDVAGGFHQPGLAPRPWL